MNIAIRVDASVVIGSGHVMRCLTLADELHRRGAAPVFVCREHEGHLLDVIEKRGFAVAPLSAPDATAMAVNCTAHGHWLGTGWQRDAEETAAVLRQLGVPKVVVVDHYALDAAWEQHIGSMGTRIAVIDDLADRSHECHWLLDQNCLSGQEVRYSKLLRSDCVRLFGPSFTLIRNEFREAKGSRDSRDGRVTRLLIFFGSVDAAGYTSRAIEVVRELEWPELRVDVVTGMANPNRPAVERLCRLDRRFDYHCQVTNMAELMARADLAISAGGFSSYELAYMGVPSILFPLSVIQSQVSAQIAARGAALSLGHNDAFPADELREALQILRRSPERCARMTAVATRLFDGAGASRVADALLKQEEP